MSAGKARASLMLPTFACLTAAEVKLEAKCSCQLPLRRSSSPPEEPLLFPLFSFLFSHILKLDASCSRAALNCRQQKVSPVLLIGGPTARRLQSGGAAAASHGCASVFTASLCHIVSQA